VPTQPTILVVDDEASIRKLVSSYLRAEGYDVAEASDGARALEEVRSRRPDLVVLDVLMPGLDGLEVLRQLRTFSDVYVVLLTARAEETDKLVGLGVGADDYVTKPFSPRELVARVKAALRRQLATAATTTPVEEQVLLAPGLMVDPVRRLVEVDGVAKDLTALEFELMRVLMTQPGRVFSRRQLLEAVWGWEHVGDERVVDVHIRNLRRALGDDAAHPRWIGTVRGVGYRFVEADR